jgi:hypothetical protein
MQIAGSDNPPMPEIRFGSHLIKWLWQFGPCNTDSTPVSWAELAAWSTMTGNKPTRWEAETLRALSEAYAVQLQQSRNAMCPAPWQPVRLSGDVLKRQVKSVFMALKRPESEKVKQQGPRKRAKRV